MRKKALFAIFASAFFVNLAHAQNQSCMPPAQPAAPGGGGRAQGTPAAGRSSARKLTIAAIPGVVAAGGQWTKVWQAGGNSADGIIPDKNGSVLVAQEDFDTVLRIDKNGKTSI